ncbi:hypothetical protein SCUCBS95973_001799 [Sporothrix curviconia]|uniref:Xylanolytic transcriptional activator regulatory domain-containing protein n=1 Tax=Sporothrix curviconia TaxID=1260050 RepID=A0ABP0B1Q1_9PEZI
MRPMQQPKAAAAKSTTGAAIIHAISLKEDASLDRQLRVPRTETRSLFPTPTTAPQRRSKSWMNKVHVQQTMEITAADRINRSAGLGFSPLPVEPVVTLPPCPGQEPYGRLSYAHPDSHQQLALELAAWGYRGGASPHSTDQSSPSRLPNAIGVGVPAVPTAAPAPVPPVAAPDVARSARPRYACLDPILARLDRIIDADLASELLQLYFVAPGGSLFQCASPYILTRVLRRASVLRAGRPRRTSPALLVAMLWTSAQEADSLFLLPSQKTRVCEDLRKLMLRLIDETDGSVPLVDTVLVFVLNTIVVSGGDCKTECLHWWDKALRLARALGLNREDVAVAAENESANENRLVHACSRHATCACRPCMAARVGLSVAEVQEENRRVFWLIFCLDRHLGLSFNSPLAVLDDDCQLYRPLPDDAWEAMTDAELASTAGRVCGPPTRVTGTGFFEYFLPLMTALGDVILLHRQKCHPRFGSSWLDDDHTRHTALVESVLDEYARSIADLESSGASGINGTSPASTSASSGPGPDLLRCLVTAYSSFILHVLHVLLHGKWDAVSMLENKDGWISSAGFNKCAAHSIAASDAVSRILACDPELAFMPYLFGIYLLHGSFILLLFADRMPQVGLNESVERACETIIRAHEVCVVTLNTEFQKQFRKALRSTLNSVRNAGASRVEEGQARRRALSLYRWSSGFTGLAV